VQTFVFRLVPFANWIRHNIDVYCVLCVVYFMYTVNNKKRDTLFLTIILANINRFLQFLYHFNCEEILHATVLKIYHITLIVCAPYFANLNNNTFRLKRYYSLFIYVHSKREQEKSSPVIKFTLLPF